MRRLVLMLLMSSACALDTQPLAFATVSGVRIATADEAGDEWLHEHCVYRGVTTVENTAAAVTAAQSRRSNFVEALSRSSEERGFYTSISYGVAFFACTENPPW